MKDEVKLHATFINNIWFADDTVVVANSLAYFHNMMDLIVEHSTQYGSDTRFQAPRPTILQINNHIVEQVSFVKYVEALVN